MSYVEQKVDSPTYTGKFQSIKDYVLLSLGWPMIRIELEDRHITLAIIEALTLWYKKAGIIEYDYRVLYPNDNVVAIPPDIRPSTIRDVLFNPGMLDSFAKGLIMAGDEDALGKYVFPQQSFNTLLNNFDMVGYYLFTQRLEDFKKMVGIDKSWDIMNGNIMLYPKGAAFTEVAIVYRALPSEIEIESEQWIKAYALSKTKMMLGTVRAKMSGMTLAGGSLSGDADALKSEAKEEIAELKAELDLLQRPLGILQC